MPGPFARISKPRCRNASQTRPLQPRLIGACLKTIFLPPCLRPRPGFPVLTGPGWCFPAIPEGPVATQFFQCQFRPVGWAILALNAMALASTCSGDRVGNTGGGLVLAWGTGRGTPHAPSGGGHGRCTSAHVAFRPLGWHIHVFCGRVRLPPGRVVVALFFWLVSCGRRARGTRRTVTPPVSHDPRLGVGMALAD